MAWPYWLFSSIFIILDENLLSCFFPSIVTSTSTFSVFGSFPSMSVSKASLVSKASFVSKQVLKLNPPTRVFSNTLTKSASVGRAIQHLLLLRWTHPEKLLALLHFLGFYLKICFSKSDLCSNISERIIVSWKLYSLFNSPRFESFKRV